MLDNKFALLFIRGERAIKDLKYDILKHPNVLLTTDGKGKPYLHGTVENSLGRIEIKNIAKKEKQKTTAPKKYKYIILDEKELKIHLMEVKENEKKQKEQSKKENGGNGNETNK